MPLPSKPLKKGKKIVFVKEKKKDEKGQWPQHDSIILNIVYLRYSLNQCIIHSGIKILFLGLINTSKVRFQNFKEVINLDAVRH